jgi:hypothetical protein
VTTQGVPSPVPGGDVSGKCEPLSVELRSAFGHGEALVELGFEDVARIVGGLPPSAVRSRQWWANGSNVQARAWRDAGSASNGSISSAAGSSSRAPRLRTRAGRPHRRTVARPECSGSRTTLSSCAAKWLSASPPLSTSERGVHVRRNGARPPPRGGWILLPRSLGPSRCSVSCGNRRRPNVAGPAGLLSDVGTSGARLCARAVPRPVGPVVHVRGQPRSCPCGAGATAPGSRAGRSLEDPLPSAPRLPHRPARTGRSRRARPAPSPPLPRRGRS